MAFVPTQRKTSVFGPKSEARRLFLAWIARPFLAIAAFIIIMYFVTGFILMHVV